jgi:hypothetical protein
MPTQEAKAHRVGEWASLRNTSPEIAEAIFEVAHYDENWRSKFGKKAAMKCWRAFEKTDKDSLFWGEQTIERKNV